MKRYCKRRNIIIELNDYISCHKCGYNMCETLEMIQKSNYWRIINHDISHQILVDEYKQKLRLKKLKRIL